MIIDIHTHVLPGVDHGAKDWETSLRMLGKSASCGVSKIIATPHYLPWKKGVNANVICELCQEAEERFYKEHGKIMDIYPGNEIYYSTETIEELKSGRALTLAGSKYVLIEFDRGALYQVLYGAVKDLRDNGYTPILAHIERYYCLDDPAKRNELRDMGAMFQMNVGTFQGGLFDVYSRRAKKCLRDGGIDFLASDMHDMEKRPPLSKEQLQWIYKKIETPYQRQLLYSNGQEILTRIKA